MVMSTMPLPLQRGSAVSRPARTGLAFAATVALFYALCTLAWVAAPGLFMEFMNNLFHGLDFTALLKPAAFSVMGFIEALMVLAVWAFAAGTFFGWLHQRLNA
jgi:hypothetical protein